MREKVHIESPTNYRYERIKCGYLRQVKVLNYGTKAQ